MIDRIAEAWKFEPFAPGPNFKRDWWMARSDTWTAADVRLLFDTLMGDTMRKNGAKRFIYKTYYSAVRYFGGLFRKKSKAKLTLGALVIAIGIMPGCNGCMAPQDIIDGSAQSTQLSGATVTLWEVAE